MLFGLWVYCLDTILQLGTRQPRERGCRVPSCYNINYDAPNPVHGVCYNHTAVKEKKEEFIFCFQYDIISPKNSYSHYAARFPQKGDPTRHDRLRTGLPDGNHGTVIKCSCNRIYRPHYDRSNQHEAAASETRLPLPDCQRTLICCKFGFGAVCSVGADAYIGPRCVTE